MKEEKHVIKKWIYYFMLAIAIILVYKFLDNFSIITNWVKQLLGVLAPFIGGIILSYILYVPCVKVENLLKGKKEKGFIVKHSRGISITIVFVLAIIFISLILLFIIPKLIESVTELAGEIPNYYKEARQYINSLPEDHLLKTATATNITNNIEKFDIASFISIEKIQGYLQEIISTVYIIYDVFLSIIIGVYILLQRKRIIRFFRKITFAICKTKTYEKIRRYFKEGNQIFFKFLSGQIFDAIIIGTILTIALTIMGVKYAPLLGFLIGILNLIPFFGAIIGIFIAFLVTIFTGGLLQAFIMGVIATILQQIDANIINPKILGVNLDISQLLVIFAVTIGGAYFGILGMFLGVPVVALIKLIVDDYIEEKTIKKKVKKKD